MIRRELPVVLVWFLVAACTVPDELETAETARAVTDHNRLSMNRLSMNRLSMNRLSMNRLSMNRLSMNRLSMNQLSIGPLANTEEGRELLAYIIRCALPAELEAVIVDEQGTELYSFPGQIGLAPEWEVEALSEAGQRWISACLLAHVNAFEISVPLSLRGPHHALETTVEERHAFTVQEGAFYGNLFRDSEGDGEHGVYDGDGDEETELSAYGCHGWQRPRVADSAYLELRTCADLEGAGCDFTVVGDCDRRLNRDAWACQNPVHASGYYPRCYSKAQAVSRDDPEPATQYDEIITVYLLDE